MDHFGWPGEIKMRDVEQFLEPRAKGPTEKQPKLTQTSIDNLTIALQQLKAMGVNPNVKGQNYFADISNGFKHKETGQSSMTVTELVPCLARTRCATGGHWSFSRQRFLTTEEMYKLMNIPPDRIKQPIGVSPRQIKQMFGNANDVLLLSRILIRVLVTSNILTPAEAGEDPHGIESVAE